MVRVNKLPSMERLCQLFECRDGVLYRRVSTSPNARAGDRAGTLGGCGYLRVRIDGTKFKVHRLVWTMHYGPIPAGMQVDHVNGDKLDNKIENLRLASHSENQMNRRGAHASSKSGVRGVSPSRSGWMARVYVNGREVRRWFKSQIVATIYADLIRHKYHSPFYGSDRTPGLAELLV